MANIPAALADLGSWSVVPAPQQLDRAERKVSGDYIGSRIKPATLYAYLKARFGEANSVVMLARANDVDNVIQWQWALATDDWLINISQFNDRLEIIIRGPSALNLAEIDAVINLIKGDFARLGPAMSAEIADFENWSLFANPFGRIAMVVEQARARLEELDLSPVVLPPFGSRKRKFDAYMKSLKTWSRNTVEAYYLCSTLRFHLPVMCEALINLIISIFVRSEIRSDQRVFQSVLRAEIDIRVKQLHLHCSGFKSPINSSDERFKAFHTLMNARNDTLHANVDVAALKVGSMQFDKIWIPLFPDSDSMYARLANAQLFRMTPDELRKDYATVLAFIELVHDHLTPDSSKILRMMAKQTILGYNDKDKRYGVLFPQNIATAFFY